jgi:RNA polymerase sigma factor (sigma-70 family)
MARDFFRQHYGQLLHHARRHIRHFELTEEIPSRALDARDIVDEAARQAEAKTREKPGTMSWLVWIYHLLHQELRVQRDALRQEERQSVSVEKQVTLPELSPQALFPLEKIVQKDMEPEVIKIEDVVADPEAAPPDQIEAAKDLLEYLQSSIQGWPRVDRDAFELYVVEGFEPEEVARITGQSLKKVKEIVAAIQQRLLEELRTEEAA